MTARSVFNSDNSDASTRVELKQVLQRGCRNNMHTGLHFRRVQGDRDVTVVT